MDSPNTFSYVALAAYIPFTLACYALLDGRRATLLSILTGWLFLPYFNVYGHTIPIFHLRQMLVPGVAVGASLLLDRESWRGFRWSWADLPQLAIWVIPFASSISNDMGFYDAVSALFEGLTKWGGAYLLARVYLATPGGLRAAADAFVKAGLVYVPLCFWEVRMSPQLHRDLYGFHQHSMMQQVRDGHFRPMVFMEHGLQVAMFMVTLFVVAYWLWRTGAQRKVAGLPMGVATLGLGIASLLTRSVGALVLMVAGVAVLELTRLLRRPALVLLFVALPTIYVGTRLSGWDATVLTELTTRYVNEKRAESLYVRLHNEDMMAAHVMQRPWFGYGRSGEFRIRNEEGRDISITDGFWIILIGIGGLTKLTAVWVMLALPVLLLLRTHPARQWGHPAVAPAAGFAVALTMWAVDNLFNAMLSPIFPAMAGSLTGYWLWMREARARRWRRPDRAAAAPRPEPTASAA